MDELNQITRHELESERRDVLAERAALITTALSLSYRRAGVQRHEAYRMAKNDVKRKAADLLMEHDGEDPDRQQGLEAFV